MQILNSCKLSQVYVIGRQSQSLLLVFLHWIEPGWCLAVDDDVSFRYISIIDLHAALKRLDKAFMPPK
jgi:hypothetical protein